MRVNTKSAYNQQCRIRERNRLRIDALLISVEILVRKLPRCLVLRSLEIAVLDDHRMFLDGLSLMVGGMAEHYHVDSYDDPLSLLRKVDQGQSFDLIICDLIMNKMNGLAFVAAIRSRTKKLPVLVLSGINSDPPLHELKRLGANGFIHKSADNENLLEAIECVTTGNDHFPEEVGKVMPGPVSDHQDIFFDDVPLLPTLGNRQVEVLQMIAQGASNKEISNTLSISENTVKTHLRQIFAELGVNKRTACVRKAQTLGII